MPPMNRKKKHTTDQETRSPVPTGHINLNAELRRRLDLKAACLGAACSKNSNNETSFDASGSNSIMEADLKKELISMQSKLDDAMITIATLQQQLEGTTDDSVAALSVPVLGEERSVEVVREKVGLWNRGKAVTASKHLTTQKRQDDALSDPSGVANAAESEIAPTIDTTEAALITQKSLWGNTKKMMQAKSENKVETDTKKVEADTEELKTSEKTTEDASGEAGTIPEGEMSDESGEATEMVTEAVIGKAPIEEKGEAPIHMHHWHQLEETLAQKEALVRDMTAEMELAWKEKEEALENVALMAARLEESQRLIDAVSAAEKEKVPQPPVPEDSVMKPLMKSTDTGLRIRSAAALQMLEKMQAATPASTPRSAMSTPRSHEVCRKAAAVVAGGVKGYAVRQKTRQAFEMAAMFGAGQEDETAILAAEEATPVTEQGTAEAAEREAVARSEIAVETIGAFTAAAPAIKEEEPFKSQWCIVHEEQTGKIKLRAEITMTSAEAGVMSHGDRCFVVEHGDLEQKGGGKKARARLDRPVKGWASFSLLRCESKACGRCGSCCT